MTSYLNIESIPFWNPAQVRLRRQIVEAVCATVPAALTGVNKAWTFHEIDGPILTPQICMNKEYSGDDVFFTQVFKGGNQLALRPETTPSSYQYALTNLRSKKDYPACVWQSGKSFRVEAADGARAATLRFNEFYQLEFQCIYAEGTMADYRTPVTRALRLALDASCLGTTRLVESDRLPSYSTCTMDVEMPWKGQWKELASISTRTDYQDGYEVLEIALGLDRATLVAEQNYAIRKETL